MIAESSDRIIKCKYRDIFISKVLKNIQELFIIKYISSNIQAWIKKRPNILCLAKSTDHEYALNREIKDKEKLG